MHVTYSMPAAIVRPVSAIPTAVVVFPQVAARRAEADRRWPAVVRTLETLRERGRRSVRIVDAACGAGDLLIEAARRARAMGFVAIEGRGADRDPAQIAKAGTAAAALTDPAIGLTFGVGEPRTILDDERDFPADIVLYAAGERPDAVGAVARLAGVVALPTTKPAANARLAA